jgi:hypothetical protein
MPAARAFRLPALQALVLGFLLCGTILLWIVASVNFSILDAKRLPLAAERLEAAGEANVRLALRHGAGELNRFFFALWNRVQIGLVLLFLLLEWVRARGRRMVRLWLGTAVLVLAAVLLFYLTPHIAAAGRAIDFVPADPPTPEREAFFRIHALYLVLDFVKLLALGVLAALAVRE